MKWFKSLKKYILNSGNAFEVIPLTPGTAVSMCVTPQNNTREVSGSCIKILPWDVHLVMLPPEEGGRGGRKYIQFWALFWIQCAKFVYPLIFKYDSGLWSLIEYSQNMQKSSKAKIRAPKVSAIIACYCFWQYLGCSQQILPNISCWCAIRITDSDNKDYHSSKRKSTCKDGHKRWTLSVFARLR